MIGHVIQSVIDHLNKPEIIIVDNHSTDQTLNIVKYFMQAPDLEDEMKNQYTKIKIKSVKDYSPGKALNVGVKHASNKHILIISAHCVLNKFNVEKHVNQLKKYACIFGKQIPVYNGKKWQEDICGVILLI